MSPATGTLSSMRAAKRPPLEGLYIYILALFIGFLVADLAITYVRPGMLPTQPPPMHPGKPIRQAFTPLSEYLPIQKRNPFNQDGVIPDPLTGADGGKAVDNVPVASQLPLKLEGTLVHSNPHKSVATISSRGKNEAQAFMVDGEIENMARLTKIERRKVIFRNLNNSRLEYIEIPKDSAVSFGMKDPQAASALVQSNGNFDFTVHRADVNKYLSNLGEVLQQARMVPNIVPGSGGRVDGFKFVNIQPDSVFEKLGFKPGDTLKRVNGEEVNSPTKGMELFNSLRSESRLQLTVERNGRDETFKFDIPDR